MSIAKKKQAYRYREQISGYQWGRVVGRGHMGVLGVLRLGVDEGGPHGRDQKTGGHMVKE